MSNFLDRCKTIGTTGGTVSTTGMPHQLKASVDIAVNAGKKS